MNRRPFEPSVIPGSYRSKQPISQEDRIDLAAVLEDSRLHLAEEEERVEQLKYRKRIGHEKAQLSFMELREGLLRLRRQRDWKLWKEALVFKKDLDRRLAEFQLDQRKVTVSRRRDVEKLFAAKCRVVVERSGPSEAEIIRSLVGGASMLNGSLRELSKKVLSRKGIIKPQTIHEKYQKVFDKYTLSPEELAERMEAMAAQLQRAAPDIRPPSDLEAIIMEDAQRQREELNEFDLGQALLETARSDPGVRGQPIHPANSPSSRSRSREADDENPQGKAEEEATVDEEGYSLLAKTRSNPTTTSTTAMEA